MHDNKEILVSHVSSLKLVQFSAELCKSVIISQEVNDIFSSLDDTVEVKLRLRYLLLKICESVKDDVTVFHRFLKVLAGYGGPAEEVARRLDEEWYMSERGAEGEAVGNGVTSSQVVGDDIYLLQDDVAVLMEFLVEVSDKWELLGISLGLPKHVISDCSRGSCNAVRMANILSEWISQSLQENITLEKLKLALSSEMVGRCAVAKILEKRFREFQKPSVTRPVANKPDFESPLKIVYQSNNTEVTDGKSTLLEAQVSGSEAVCYQWMKDGLSLADNLAYSGTHTAILVISLARQGTEGKYTCHITIKGSKKVISREILLTVSFPPEKKHLIKLYSKNPEVPRDSWPPKVTTTFINLALITKKNEVTDDYKSSVRGDVDDILETKEKVEFAAVFGEYESGALVLVEGRPGSGKTTLVHKITRDWATGRGLLKNTKLVFLIPLRSLANRNTEQLSDILDLLYLDKEECEKVVHDIKQAKGEGVCFIIDGLDEFLPQEETKSVIHKLLYEKYLPAAMVIVASRPVATDKLRREPHVTRRIEVLGFNQQQIFEYIDNFPFTSDTPTNSDTSPSQLKAYLNSHHNLLHMCYLPVHVGMICFLYEHERGDIPLTETEIYEHFTRFIVLRNLRRSNDKAELSSLEDLRGKDQEYFMKICHLAFDMTIHSTQTVHQKETKVPLSFGTCPNDAPSLGLLTIDRTAGLHQLHDTYAFLHLTFQEYLAAVYLTKLKRKEQMKMIKLYAGEKHMRMMWKLYCGIVKSEDKVAEIQHVMWPVDKKRPKHASLYEVHCAFVSQQCFLCDSFVEGRAGVLDFSDCILTPADVTAVSYVISTTSHLVTELVMCGCHLHDDHVRTLLREVGHNKLKCIKKLSFLGNNIGANGAVALADGLKSCNSLQTLKLSSNSIGDDGTIALADGLKSCNNLQVLLLSNNSIGDDGTIALADGLKSCNNLQILSLNNNNIGAEGAIALADGLKSCNNLQTLSLDNNRIGADGAIALAVGLKSCNNLRALYLRNINIGADGAIAIADGLKYCINLQRPGLDINNIGARGWVALRFI